MTEFDPDAGPPRYFGPDGEPIRFMEWAEMLGRRCQDMALESWWRKLTKLDDGVSVSSVWIGMNMRLFTYDDPPPLIWETMIFGGDYEERCWRYPSRQSCLDDHERIVRALRAGCAPEEAATGV